MKKNKHKRSKPLVPLLVVIGILLIGYLIVAVYFMNHFYFHTTINGEKATGLTVSQVQDKISQEVKKYQISLEERDKNTEIIQGQNIELKATFDDSIQKLLKEQNSFLWLPNIFKTHKETIHNTIVYDKDKLAAQIAQLSCTQAKNQQQPVNATVSDYDPQKGYVIVAEEQGNTIDQSRLEQVIATSVENLKKSVSLEENNCYVSPMITKDTKELQKAVDTLNKYVSTKVTYDFGKNQEVLDGSTIHTWLSLDDDLSVKLDNSKVKSYVKELAREHNTAGRAKNFTTPQGEAITISGGNYGWKINQSDEVKQLILDIQNGTVEKRDPAYTQKANSHGANDYGDTYVAVDLTAQHLVFYKNGKLVTSTDFVSGSILENDATPTGSYFVNSKETDRFLTGPDYKSHVDYWMPFNGDVGLHDASWRSSFGGSIYLKHGSHGCVNLPASAAKTIFNSIEVGNAVLVYQTAPTPVVADPAAVVAKINMIGPVTVQSQTIMTQIRNEYNSLTDAQKAQVTNYNVFVADEATLAALLAGQTVAQ